MNMKSLMEEDIKSQGKIITNLINKYVVNYCVLLDVPLLIKKIVFVASGSSYNASVLGKYFIENIAQIEASAEYASEFSISNLTNYDPETLYVFISQSGNSSDVVKSFEKVKEKGAKTLCITNNSSSKLYNECEFKFLLEAGAEKAIAATKTFSATVMMLWLIAVKIAQNKHLDVTLEVKNIYKVESEINSTLNDIANLDVVAKLLSKQKDFSLVGYSYNYPLAREAALKIKELNYINTSSYPLGEFVHGHFALLNKSKVFLAFVTGEVTPLEKELLQKVISTYKPKTILITDEYEDYNSDILLKFPKATSKISTILSSIITLQLLALEIAQKLKRNIDKPKGLLKVVENKE